MPAIDRAELLDTIDGDLELLGWMVGVFTRDSAELLTQIDTALHAGDNTAARRATHSLKGMLGTAAAHPAVATAVRLEALLAADLFDDAMTMAQQLATDTRAAAQMLADVAREEGAETHNGATDDD